MDLNFATAHLIGFLQRKKIIAGGKPVLADFGTLTYVPHTLPLYQNNRASKALILSLITW